MLEYLYGKRFGSRYFRSCHTPSYWLTLFSRLSPSFLLAHAIFEVVTLLHIGSRYFRGCHPHSYWLTLFSSQTFSRINILTSSNLVILHTYLRMKMEQTVCSETSAYKIQRPGITQKKAYDIQNKAKVWNQEYMQQMFHLEDRSPSDDQNF